MKRIVALVLTKYQKVTRFNPISVASFFCRASVLMNSFG
jgi:hypothetical protein